VTRAAEELGMTPGAVSRHVRALEAWKNRCSFVVRPAFADHSGRRPGDGPREGLDRIADEASGAKLRPVGAPVQTWPPEWSF
jgi:LysR family transcriptional regulator, glycine cleavage system transcriptional activator